MRIIQLGVGALGRSWAQVVLQSPGADLVGIVEPSEAARERAERDLGIGAAFASLDEALTAVECDAVLVVTPEDTHFELVGKALAAGKHVMVEKPMTATLDEARELVERAAQAERVLMVSQQYRFRPAARTVQRLIEGGGVGAILGVRSSCRRDTRELWRENRYRLEVNHPYLLGMAIHHFDLLRMLTGLEVESVYCRGWRAPDSPYIHEPTVAALMALDGGATFAYEGDWACRNGETSWDGEWEILGEEGRILWRGNPGQQVLLERWGEPMREVGQVALPVTDQHATLDSLRRAVEERIPPETGAGDNIRSLAIVAACTRSVETGELISPSDLLAGSVSPTPLNLG